MTSMHLEADPKDVACNSQRLEKVYSLQMCLTSSSRVTPVEHDILPLRIVSPSFDGTSRRQMWEKGDYIQ